MVEMIKLWSEPHACHSVRAEVVQVIIPAKIRQHSTVTAFFFLKADVLGHRTKVSHEVSEGFLHNGILHILQVPGLP